jgi:RND family efflux transporter MFP subunit
VNDKIDRLAELQIDRSAEPAPSGRWRYVVFAVIAAVGAALLLLRVLSPGAINVESQTVRAGQSAVGGTSVLDASGYVVARRQATVSSKIAGKVLEVLIEEGMTVKKDQVVATLDASTQRAQLALAEAQLSSAKASLDEIQAQLTQAELDLVRARELAARQLASASELDAAKANAETLRARLAVGRENVIVALRSMDVSKDQLDNTIIRAPFAGVVVTKNAQPGEMISPISAGGGFTRTGICTIVDMESLEIEVDVNEAYIQRVRPDQSVNATLDAYPDWRISAEVIAIVPTADRQKATVRVRIGFLESDARILRDMGVKVSFLGTEEPASSAMPVSFYIADDALQSDSDGTFVWIIRDGAVQRRAVTIGQSSNQGLQILAGLSAGDRVVVSSEEELTAGQPVEVVNGRGRIDEQ